jgi:hypothetical protein
LAVTGHPVTQVPTIPTDADLTGAQAMNIMGEGAFNLFPGLQTKTLNALA